MSTPAYEVALLAGAPERLMRLALARLARRSANGAVAASVSIDARVVIDESALSQAVARAVALRRTVLAPAREIDGSLRNDAARIVPRDTAEPPVTLDDPVGQWLPLPVDRAVPGRGAAVNIFTHLFGATGYAAVGRGLGLGLAQLGRDVRYTAEWGDMGDPGLRPGEFDRLSALVRAPVRDAPSVLIAPAVHQSGLPNLENYRAIRVTGPCAAYTMFECDGVPPRWPASLNRFESVWVPSTFNLASFAAGGVDAGRLRVVPIGIDAPRYADGDAEPPALPNRRGTAYLAVFDWNERKGADVLLRAWAAAFDATDDVVLYLRTGRSTVGAQGDLPRLLAELRLDAGRMAPIEVLSEDLPAARYEALFRAVDAFVLTSRGEAFGIPLLEAMAAGLPTIGTDFGGSTDFLDATTGYPVPYRLVPVAPALAARIGYYAGQRWADPSVEATAAALRRIVEDPADAAARAAAGFVRAQLEFDRRATAQIAARTLDAIPERRTLVRGSGAATIAGPLHAADDAGGAMRAVAAALIREGVVVRLEDRGAAEVVDEPDAARSFREHLRIVAEPGDLRIVVGEDDPAADVVVATAQTVLDPTATAPVWLLDGAPDPSTARAVRRIPAPLDVDRWTPDVRAGRTAGVISVIVGGEPRWAEAARLIIAAAATSAPLQVLIRGGDGTPDEISPISQVLEPLLGVATVRPTCVFVPSAQTLTARAAAFGHAAFALAVEPERRSHDVVRACGVPVIESGDVATVVVRARRVENAWSSGRRERRDAVARATAARAELRDAFEERATVGATARPIAPIRIALEGRLTPSLVARLTDRAVHRVVVGEDADYVAEIDGIRDASPGWDEVLVNALHARPIAVARATRYDELAPTGAASGPVPPFRVLADGAFLLFRDAGQPEPAPRPGIRMRRAGTPANAGTAYLVHGCLVEPGSPDELR